MKARHLFVAAALFAGLFALWMIGTTPAPAPSGAPQTASMLQPF